MKTREETVALARQYLGTPYVHGGMIRGAGVDCATLLFDVYKRCGLLEEEDFGVFKGDWWAHTTTEVYMQRMLRHAAKVAETTCSQTSEALPGCVVLVKSYSSKVYNHGAIVTAWPLAIEAVQSGVREVEISRTPMWLGRAMAIFDPWIKREATV